jgi:hypothetical protein
MPTGPRRLRLRGTSVDAGSADDALAVVFGALDSSGGADTGTPQGEEGPRNLDALAKQIAEVHRYDGITSSFRPASPSEDELTPAGSEAVARRVRHVYRDARLRLSGEVFVPVDVTG